MTLKFGVLGDSGVDAYRGTDNRGGSYAAVTFNPIELLQRLRGFDLGLWSTYSEPRRTDYAHNWARSGAQTLDMATQGQVDGLVAQVSSGAVEYVYIRIGANDFAWYFDLYGDIYDQSLTGSALTAELHSRADAVIAAIDALQTAGALGIVARNFGYWGDAQAIAAGFTDATGRQRVMDAVAAINAYMNPLLDARGVAWVDVSNTNVAFETNAGHTGLWVGKQFLNLDEFSDEPHAALLADQTHDGTVMSGLEVNGLIIEPLNARYNLGIRPLTYSELWLEAGVLAGGVFGSIARSAN